MKGWYNLCKDVPGLLYAALVRQNGPDPVGRPNVPRVILQHGLEVVDSAVLVAFLLQK